MKIPLRALVTAGSLLVTGCGPATQADIGVTQAAGHPTVVLYVCDDQPHLTVRVYYAQRDTANYTLTGHAKKHETVRVPLVAASAGWVLHGVRMPLPSGKQVEADAEDGSGSRLNAAVYFTLAEMPASPEVGVGDSKLVRLTTSAFAKRASSLC